jgi:hypothetical protein
VSVHPLQAKSDEGDEIFMAASPARMTPGRSPRFLDLIQDGVVPPGLLHAYMIR